MEIMNKESILDKFNAEMKRRKIRLHSAVLVSGEKVIDEVYNAPYTADTKTRMYSSSKSVAAVAVGKLVREKKITLDDKVVDIFADRFDMTNVDERLKEQTVRDMLRMQTCHSKPTYNQNTRNWLESYFTEPATHHCRTFWYYDSCGSYVIGAITKQITGMDFVQYLRPEFDIMGVSKDVYCLQGPDGEAWASSGFIATASDLAKIAYLLLNKGRWNGHQLLDEDFAMDATSQLVQIHEKGETSRFNCGYGYQIWGHADGAFAFRGLGGQVAIGFPGRDLVFACNADTACANSTYDDIFYTVESMILPHFPITDQKRYDEAQPKAVTDNIFESIKDMTYMLEKNPMGIGSVRFTGEDGSVKLSYTRGDTEYSIPFEIGRETQIIFPEKYTGSKLFSEEHYMNYQCSISAEWTEPSKLFIRVWAEDIYVGNMSMCFAFREDGKISVKMNRYAQFYFDNFNGIACGEAAE